MRNLRNIVLGCIISLPLLFSGCKKSKEKEKVSQEITENKNAYDEALKIANNPRSIFTGEVSSTTNIPQTQLEPKNSKSLVRKEDVKKVMGLEDYFLEGKEKYFFNKEEIRIGNLRLATMDELEGNMIGSDIKRNPSVTYIEELTDEEREQVKKDMGQEWGGVIFDIESAEELAENYLRGMIRGGTAHYNFMGPREENRWGGDVVIFFTQFKSIQDIEHSIFKNNLTKWMAADHPNLLAKDTIISIVLTGNYDEDNYLNYLKLLLNYQERIGAEPITDDEDLKREKYTKSLRDYIDKNQ